MVQRWRIPCVEVHAHFPGGAVQVILGERAIGLALGHLISGEPSWQQTVAFGETLESFQEAAILRTAHCLSCRQGGDNGDL